MVRNNIKVVGVSELWWLGKGRFTTDNENIFSGKESGGKQGGVGFLIEKETVKCVLGYDPISERVIIVRIQGHPINIPIIQVYAPTSDAADEDIEDFYETAQSAVDSIPKRDFLIIMGDWNAKIGKTEKSECLGQYGLGTRNERGDKLEEFFMANGLVIGNTLNTTLEDCGHGQAHGITRNQIDYIMIKKR